MTDEVGAESAESTVPIAAGVGGGVAVLLIIIVVIVLLVWKRKRGRSRYKGEWRRCTCLFRCQCNVLFLWGSGSFLCRREC